MRKTLILILVFSIFGQYRVMAQTKFRIGVQGGAVISKTVASDTLGSNFTRRNRLGATIGIQSTYDIKPNISLTLGANYVNKGYKFNNDTLRTSASVVRKINSLTVPFGLSFRQRLKSNNFITERFGVIGNYNLGPDSVTIYNNKNNPKFRVTEIRQNKIYPMFYLGVGMGGTADNGDRFDVSIIYNQSFSNDALARVESGKNYSKSFPAHFRGGFLQVSFTYCFDLTNFRKSNEYFE